MNFELVVSGVSGSFARVPLGKQVMVAGTEATHDLVLSGDGVPSGMLFTLIRAELAIELMPGRHKIRVNGFVVQRKTKLSACDRIEWPGGAAVLLESRELPAGGESQSVALRSLSVLQDLADSLRGPGSVGLALDRLLEALVTMAGAETGALLSEVGDSGWSLVAERDADPGVGTQSGAAPRDRGTKRRELISNTILQESMRKREPVCVENIVGHPWSEAASVIEARIFSAACLPLIIAERVVGAVFLISRSPGKSIRKERLGELGLLASQAALLLGLETELRSTRRENERLRTLVGASKADRGGLIFDGKGPMAEVARKLERLAQTPLSVILLGETGTGKEVAARELHRLSARASGPFVAINCAAIPAPLLESTLFGHEKGAFTGAVRAHLGKFQQAAGGTLFLDEIGDLPLELQSKLLRALQEKSVEPVGGSAPVAVDVRIVAATHQDLESAIRAGRFRGDLYFRLSGAVLRLPPLRERAVDLPSLVEHFIRAACGGPSAAGLAPALGEAAWAALRAHSWPGNIRELEQVITRAALLCEGGEICSEDLELERMGLGLPGSASGLDLDSLKLEEAQLAFTQDFVRRALEQRSGNRAEAAAALGISERTLYRILAADSHVRPV